MSMMTNAQFNEGMPVGSIVMYSGESVPNNWAWCNGSSLSRNTYSELFSVISTKYGPGNGSTTFNVPDFRDRLPIGKTDTGTIGAKAGSKTQRISIGVPLVPHAHTVPASGISVDALTNPGNPNYVAYNANPLASANTSRLSLGPYTIGKGGQYYGYTGDIQTDIKTTSSGTGKVATSGDFSIMPPTISTNFIIKIK